MGIQGLWSVLEPTAEPVTLESLEGKRLAVDISIWLHQATHGYTEHQLNAKSPHLSLVLRRLSKLLFYKIRPLFIFDGPNVPVFKRKLLRDRQVKRYVEELTMTKAQKRALRQLAGSQIDDNRHVMDELKTLFAPSSKKKREDEDLFAVSEPSTSKETPKMKEDSASESEPEIVYSHESSRSSVFDQAEFDSFATRDERVDYLLAAREKVRSSLRLREVPDDSRAFSSLQIDRLLKRNRINEQLQLVKNEALKERVLFSSEQGFTGGNIKLAAMEGSERVHIITDDSEVQVVDEEKEAKEKRVVDSLAWPVFLEQMKQDEGVEKVVEDKEGQGEAISDDEDDPVQEAIHASLLEDIVQSNPVVPLSSHGKESKGDMIERLRAAFAERTRGLQHDSWSSTSSSGDEFVEVPELQEDFFKKPDAFPSSSRNALPREELLEKCSIEEKQHIDERFNENKKDAGGKEEPVVDDNSSMHLKPACDVDIFSSAREEGIYKDCQELFRICGIPYVVAPGEAEAQCCELERLGLVHGIISDDSDVWLFGAAVVYKNMFNQKRRLQMYSSKIIQNQLGLSRWEAIQIALLSGGDYTGGLEGVGVVSALELVAEFAASSRQVDAEPKQEAFETLQRISTWMNRSDETDAFCDDLPSSSSSGSGHKEYFKKAITRKGMENARRLKLRRLIEKNNVAETLESFPSREVFNAYANPLVDSSTEKPKWRKINLEELESYVWEKLGWDPKHLEKQTNKSLLKWNDYLTPAAGGSGQSYQMHITSFAHSLQKSVEDQRLLPTARVHAALQRLVTSKNSQMQAIPECSANENAWNAEIARNTVSAEKLRKKPPKKVTVRKTVAKRKNLSNISKKSMKNQKGSKNMRTTARKELRLSEESSSSDVN